MSLPTPNSRFVLRIIIATSTYPSSVDDHVPRFVADQAQALLDRYPELAVWVNAPHTPSSMDGPLGELKRLHQERFHYFWPRGTQSLASGAMMPTLKDQPWLIIQVPFLFLSTTTSLWRLARRVRPDYIYAHWFTPQGIAASLVARLTRTPWVLTTHASDVEVWNRLGRLGRRIVRSCLRNVTAVTAVSSRTCDKLRLFFDDDEWADFSERVKIIPMGIDHDALSAGTEEAVSALRVSHDLAAAGDVVLFMARLTEKKGLQYLLPALAQLRHRGHTEGLKVLVAGDGEYREHLENMAVELDLGDLVEFVGFVVGDHKFDLIALADILVVPSIVTESGDAEGLPVSLLEGLAAGKLCIATTVSGADDIIEHGVHGILVADRDPGALADAMTLLRTMSAEERATMQGNATEAARRFDWRRIAEDHHDFFTSRTKDSHTQQRLTAEPR